MNLERMKQAAIDHSKESDKWAVVCTDGDIEYARTDDTALTIFEESVQSTEHLSGKERHDHGLVRVDE